MRYPGTLERAPRAVSNRSAPRSRWLEGGLALVAVFGLGILVGRWFGAESAQPVPSRVSVEPAQALKQPVTRQAVPARAAARKSSLASAAPEAADEEAEERVREYRAKQAGELIGLVTYRLRLAERSVLGQTPEGAANQLLLYQAGLMDGLTRTSPELSAALSQHIEQAMCDEKTKTATLISFARMVSHTPDLATTRGFDCLFKPGRSEDVALWSALDAYRHAKLPPGESLEALSRSANHEHTKVRIAAIMKRAASAGDSPPAAADTPAYLDDGPSSTQRDDQEENHE